MDLFKPIKVFAQVDGVASPTIPFTAPGEVTPTVVVPTATDAGPSITLNADTTTLNVGDTVLVEVVIDTNLQPINAYTIQILYNPELAEVVDFDDTTDLIETDFLDTFFDPLINEVSQSQGIITIQAENPAGSSSITDRIVATFEVEAIKTGFVDFTFGEENTSLTTSGSENILQSTNSLDFVISGEAEPTAVTTQVPGQTVSPTSEIPFPSQTPQTALPDGLRTPVALVAGVLLISLGTYIYRLRDPNATKKV